MAFKRSMLESMGLEAGQIDEIMKAHVEVVNALKDERDKIQETLDETQRQLGNSKSEIKDWQTKYEGEHTAFEDFKTATTKAETKKAKESAYREALVKAGVPDKVIPSILRIADLEGVEFDESGAVKDAAKLVESAKTSWADFIPSSGEKRDNPDNPPSAPPSGKEAFEAMSLSQQMQYANAHPDEVAAYLK